MDEKDLQSRSQMEFVKFMSRHLVAMLFKYQSYDGDGAPFHRGCFAWSGFVIEFHGHWFWTTAGHCIRNTNKLIQNGLVQIESCVLVDYFGTDASNPHAVPFWYDGGKVLPPIENRKAGLDFSLIQLPVIIKRNLQANNIIPINRRNWERQNGLNFEHYAILGFPDGSIDDEGNMIPTLVAIDRIDRSEVDESYSDAWFIGRLNSNTRKINIEGMSGGPVYGFRRNEEGNWAYHVVALQSSWLPERRITFGCSVPYFAEQVYNMMQAD